MNKSLVLFCLLVLLSCTRVRSDLSLGYRYNQGHSSAGGLLLQAPGSVVTSYNPTGSAYSYFASQPSVGQVASSGFSSSAQSNKQVNFGAFGQQNTNFGSGFSSGVGGAGSFGATGGSAFNAGFGGSSQIGTGSFYPTQGGEQQSFTSPIISKHFYIHTVPPDDDEEEIVRHIQVGQPQKNYRVVFINTASSHATKAKIIADIAPTEEKTAIYVLAKKNDAFDISSEVNAPAPASNNPEVFFVKYKTPEEAVHVQHSIQEQYDALGGTTDISNEGQVPVSSVAGTLQTFSSDNDISSTATLSDASLTSNIQQTYLPTNSKLKYK